MPIYFYGTRQTYGCFSNFSAHGFELDGLYWRTSEGACAPRRCRYSSEHYFQAQKFAGHPEHLEAIRRMASPKQAAHAGRSRARPLRPDREQVKGEVMRKAVLRKFETHAGIREILLSTGEQEIIENAPGDYYWGCGQEGTGKNMLGISLMETRQILRQMRRKL